MRAAIFIDGAYMDMYAKRKNIQIDYENLSEYLMTPIRQSIPVDMMRCYFYNCPPWQSEVPSQDEIRRMNIHSEFEKMIHSLDRWQMRMGKLQKRRDGDKEIFEQKRVDVLLSCDLVRHAAAGHIQHAILVAGDSDFIPAVAAAKDSGVTITLWHNQGRSVHNDLADLADQVKTIDYKIIKKATKKAIKATEKGVQKKKTTRRKKIKK